MRYYENKFPIRGDRVVVRVKSFSDMGAYVSLLEYGDIEGMIPMGDLSHREVKKSTSIGNIEVVIVTEVDEEKGYIDLTKKGVVIDDVIDCEKRWTRSRWIDLAVQHLSGKESIEHIYETMVWTKDPEIDITVETLQRQLSRYTARVDVMIYRYDKIDSIKEGFLAGLSASEDIISIQVDRSPSYKITLYTNKKDEIHKVCNAIINKIMKLGGEAIER